ncbi:Fur family transcriptional regulator [Spirochaeta lutea]|uniref:Fur family transcriptional regulator n=1 Tax=Spirochaeta lutea TaxID=1480694 RepID=UPI00055FF11F|nr:transcriptional repressor [Spirochaeta lutea]
MTVSKFRKSAQRERLFQVIAATDTHPTAQWLYDQLKPEFPSLSLGNLYRNLHILQEQGRIERLNIPGSDTDRYDVMDTPHYHLICTSCNRIFDVPAEGLDGVIARVQGTAGFTVSQAYVQFTGLCADCRNR